MRSFCPGTPPPVLIRRSSAAPKEGAVKRHGASGHSHDGMAVSPGSCAASHGAAALPWQAAHTGPSALLSTGVPCANPSRTSVGSSAVRPASGSPTPSAGWCAHRPVCPRSRGATPGPITTARRLDSPLPVAGLAPRFLPIPLPTARSGLVDLPVASRGVRPWVAGDRRPCAQAGHPHEKRRTQPPLCHKAGPRAPSPSHRHCLALWRSPLIRETTSIRLVEGG